MLLVVLLAGGGAALYYFKFRNPKQSVKGSDEQMCIRDRASPVRCEAARHFRLAESG